MELVYENDKTQWYRRKATEWVDDFLRNPFLGPVVKDYKAFQIRFKDENNPIGYTSKYVFFTKDQEVIECYSLDHMVECAHL